MLGQGRDETLERPVVDEKHLLTIEDELDDALSPTHMIVISNVLPVDFELPTPSNAGEARDFIPVLHALTELL